MRNAFGKYSMTIGKGIPQMMHSCSSFIHQNCRFETVVILNRVNKQGRAAGVLENFEEGKKYSEHSLRKLVRNRRPEIMPSINSFFADPQKN